MTEGEEGRIDQRLIKALAHPLRVRILMALADGEATPGQIADVLDENLSNVAYHVRALAEYDSIELVDTRTVRGATEHVYRAKLTGFLGSTGWQHLPAKLRASVASEALRSLIAKVANAVESESVEERKSLHFTWVPLTVDEEGWSELLAMVADLEARLNELNRRCGKRLKSGAGISVIAVLAFFQADANKRIG